MSISELAYESGVAEATISRFCRRLKLKGYNAFKLAVAKATAEDVYKRQVLHGAVDQRTHQLGLFAGAVHRPIQGAEMAG